MIKLLFVASTEFEVENTLKSFFVFDESIHLYRHKSYSDICFLISGVGILSATMNLTQMLEKYDVKNVINIGFCGSFSSQYSLGSIVRVNVESFPDLGILNKIDDIDILCVDGEKVKTDLQYEYLNLKYIPNIIDEMNVSTAKGATVQSCTNNQVRADYFANHFKVDIETMEGGACMYVCKEKSVGFVQFRVVSNMIPGRSAERWNILRAKTAINQLLANLLKKLY